MRNLIGTTSSATLASMPHAVVRYYLQACVVPACLYPCEPWPLSAADAARLDTAFCRRARQLMRLPRSTSRALLHDDIPVGLGLTRPSIELRRRQTARLLQHLEHGHPCRPFVLLRVHRLATYMCIPWCSLTFPPPGPHSPVVPMCHSFLWQLWLAWQRSPVPHDLVILSATPPPAQALATLLPPATFYSLLPTLRQYGLMTLTPLCDDALGVVLLRWSAARLRLSGPRAPSSPPAWYQTLRAYLCLPASWNLRDFARAPRAPSVANGFGHVLPPGLRPGAVLVEPVAGGTPPYSLMILATDGIRHDIDPPHGVLLCTQRLSRVFKPGPERYRPFGRPSSARNSLLVYIVPDVTYLPPEDSHGGPSYVMPFDAATFPSWLLGRMSVWYELERSQERTTLFPPETPGTRLLPPLVPLALDPASGARILATDGSASGGLPSTGWAVRSDTGLSVVGHLSARSILPAECFAALTAVLSIDELGPGISLLTDNMSVHGVISAALSHRAPPRCTRRYPYAAALFRATSALPVSLRVTHVPGSAAALEDQNPLQHDADQLAREGRLDHRTSCPPVSRYTGLHAALRAPDGDPAPDLHAALPCPTPLLPEPPIPRVSPPMKVDYFTFPAAWQLFWMRVRYRVWRWQPPTCPTCGRVTPDLEHVLLSCPPLPPEIAAALPPANVVRTLAWATAGYQPRPTADLTTVAQHLACRWLAFVAAHAPIADLSPPGRASPPAPGPTATGPA